MDEFLCGAFRTADVNSAGRLSTLIRPAYLGRYLTYRKDHPSRG